MADRFVPERINDFLVERAGRRYCDSCIQERLGLKWRQQVQLVTATLAVTPSFTRARSECCTCHEVKQVIVALEPRPAAELRSSQRPAPGGAQHLRRGQV